MRLPCIEGDDLKNYSGFVEKICLAMWMLAAMLGAVSLMGCEADEGERMLNEEKLQKIRVGSFVRLSDLIHENADIVYILYPYQNRVEDRYPQSVVVNKYLENIKYQASEGYWSLVVLTSGSPKHYTFKRSKSLDIFATHGLKSSATIDLPVNFEMAEWASFDRSALFKTSISERIYMIFGSVK